MITIALFEPEKPANVGNIIRTCMAMDLKLAIIGDLTFQLTDKAFTRAKMDYCNGFDIARFKSIDEFLSAHHKDDGYFVTRYSNKIYSDYNLEDTNKNYFFMFGKESTGLPKKLLLDNFDKTMRIPMAANCRSLNLSNTVSIVASECLRQQNFLSLATSEVIKGEDFLQKFNK